MKRQQLTFLLSFCIALLYGQQQESYDSLLLDVLTRKSYEELEHNFNEVRYDFTKAECYAKAYLKKSIADKDIIKQANSYYFLSKINTFIISEHYADSIISLTKNMKHHTYPAKGYIAKAIALERRRKYRASFYQLLKALEYANANNNVLQQLEVKYQVGLIRTDRGKHEKARDDLKTYLHKIKEEHHQDKNYAYHYSKALYALGDLYNQNRHYDSAAIFAKKGLEFALKHKNSLNPAYFRLTMGITAYFKEDYDTSLVYLQKAAEAFKMASNIKNLMTCYFYMGNVYDYTWQEDNVVFYYKKIDSIVEATPSVFPLINVSLERIASKEPLTVFPFMKDVYAYLSHHYKKGTLVLPPNEGNRIVNRSRYILSFSDFIGYNSEKDFIEKTLKNTTGIAIGDMYRDFELEIVNNYDIPEKTREIEALNNDKLVARTWVLSLSAIVLLVSFFTYYYYKRQRSYRSKFEALLTKNESVSERPANRSKTAIPDDLNISEKALSNITGKLKVFIGDEQFLNNDISLHTLAKSMGTNPSYLSKVINFYQQKNFSAYITELRINYAVEVLKTNAVFRKYSIKAIAEETGFNTEQSFSRAFYKKTGIYPSYFIRELEKNLFEKKQKNL